MIGVVRMLGVLIALGIAALSCVMTFAFGLSFSDGAERYAFAALFGALDAAKFILPTCAAALALNGVISKAKTARFCWVFFALLSACSHIGLTLKASDDARTAQSGVVEAESSYKAKKGELNALGTPRSKGKIDADISIAERDPIFTDERKSNRCVNDTIDASREFCGRYKKLTGERSDRADFDRLTGEVAEAKRVLDKARGTGGKANAMAKAVSETFSVGEGTAMMILAIMMAIGIEMGSSILLELVTAAGFKPRQEDAKPVPDAIPAPNMTPNDADLRQMVPEKADLPVMDAREWMDGRMTSRKGASTLFDDVMAVYVAEAGEAGMKPQSNIMLSKAINGPYETKRVGGKTRVVGATVKEKKAVTKLKVVK